ncbi:MAG: sugar phosphate isomerase/epimerase [Planctomycetes bacterium]|nr:sugar phosphate isomerase/epimerase [Planctomycetota bacterium]
MRPQDPPRPPRIILGVNLTFAKFVYGRKRALDVARDDLDTIHVEMVPDIDFGPALFLEDPDAFRRIHGEVAAHARAIGVSIDTVLTFYRDPGAIAHPDPAVRLAAWRAMESISAMAGIYGARYASAAFGTMHREDHDDPRRREALWNEATGIWERWMQRARAEGLERVLVETGAALREECATIAQTRAVLARLEEIHARHPETTCPTGLVYDTGHGVSREESDDDDDRDFLAWFRAFPEAIREIHLKDTDPEFLETWPFTYASRGIIDPRRVVRGIRDALRAPEIYLMLEIPGKRGREIGERRAIEDLRASIAAVRDALGAEGYREDPRDRTWGFEGAGADRGRGAR